MPDEQYHAVPEGWDEEAILALHRQLGGTFALRAPLPNPRHRDYPYGAFTRTLGNLPNGIRAGDNACAEVAIRFIEAHFIISYSGFIRARLARALKHAELTEQQRHRLSAHFLEMLLAAEKCDEFREYLRLWARVAAPEHVAKVRRVADGPEGEPAAFARKVLQRLSPPQP